jgi:hypothetical protein
MEGQTTEDSKWKKGTTKMMSYKVDVLFMTLSTHQIVPRIPVKV